MAATRPFGVEFAEVDDWNCCGATEYIALNLLAAYTLVTRNLALTASMQGLEDGPYGERQLVAPCSACFLNLSKVERYLSDSPSLRAKVNEALAAGGMHYEPGGLRVRHLLDVVVNDIGLEAIAAKVTNPLKGLRVAPYYGCLIVRPAFQGVFDDHEYPTSLDRLLETLGARVVDFSMKAQCCGGHMTQISQPVALDMLRRIFKNAADSRADLIVTLCPMCQLNLDAYQGDVNRYFRTNFNLPVLYFTQLMGLALGIPAEELEIGKEFVDARPALARIGQEPPDEEAPGKKKRPPKEALPMPGMAGGGER
jgi:heterodisulfide reductase subunit B